VTRGEAFNRLVSLPTRLLYGGITEEILLRWGVLTLLVWVAWRIFQRGRRQPGAVCFVGAILISSIVFGDGHLPVAVAIGGQLTLPVVVYVVTGNSVFGLMAGIGSRDHCPHDGPRRVSIGHLPWELNRLRLLQVTGSILFIILRSSDQNRHCLADSNCQERLIVLSHFSEHRSTSPISSAFLCTPDL
jgi:hypothetical protein